MSTRKTGFTFVIKSLSFILNRIFLYWTCEFILYLFEMKENSHFCLVNIAYMLFVNTGVLIQIYFS